jgi:hypothetical protein
LRQGWGVNRRRDKKIQFKHGRKRFGQESKLQQSGKERGEKVFFCNAGLKKISAKSCPNCQKVVKKLTKDCQKAVKKLSKSCQKVVKKCRKDKLIEGRFLSPEVAPGKNLQILK